MTNIKEVKNIPIDEIVPDKNQPRQLFEPSKLATLQDSVRRYGVMTPVTVEFVEGKYLLVDGERRYRVSKELGLKTIPAVVIEPRDEVEKLVQQFHIQEQHEEWTPTEKASAVYKLSQSLGTSIQQMCDLLSITPTTARRYLAFSNLLEKKEFVRNEIGLDFAPRIHGLKVLARKLYMEKLQKSFPAVMEKSLEQAVIRRIAS